MPDRKTKPHHPRHFPDPWAEVDFKYRHGEQCGELEPADQHAFLKRGGLVPSALWDGARIQDCLNLLSFKSLCPGNALKKAAEGLMKMMLGSKKILRFRAEFPINARF